MTDLSGYSTEDLQAALQSQAGPAAPDLSGYSTEDLQAALKAAPPQTATPGALDYVFRGAPVNAVLGMGDAVRSTDPNAFPADPLIGATTMMPRQDFNKKTYGSPEIQPPSDAARYSGAVTSGFATNPALSLMAPGYTVAGTLGSEGASDLNKAYGPSWLPDWAARFIGGVAGGGVYGAGRYAAANMGVNAGGDAAVRRAAEVMDRVKAGEGRLGAFQTEAQKAADELTQASAKMPQIPPDHVLPVSNTEALLNSPAGRFIPNTDGIRKIIADNKGAMFFGELDALKDKAGAAGESALYNALKADHRAAIIDLHGEGASAVFDQANAARQAQWLLNKSVDPSGLYNPLMLTRKLAVSPGGETVANATSGMSALTDRANELYDMVAPVVRANQPKPGIVSKLLPLGVAGASHALGIPGGELIAGSLLNDHAATLNPLYALPSARAGGLLASPFMAGEAGTNLTPSRNRPSGLLGR